MSRSDDTIDFNERQFLRDEGSDNISAVISHWGDKFPEYDCNLEIHVGNGTVDWWTDFRTIEDVEPALQDLNKIINTLAEFHNQILAIKDGGTLPTKAELEKHYDEQAKKRVIVNG